MRCGEEDQRGEQEHEQSLPHGAEAGSSCTVTFRRHFFPQSCLQGIFYLSSSPHGCEGFACTALGDSRLNGPGARGNCYPAHALVSPVGREECWRYVYFLFYFRGAWNRLAKSHHKEEKEEKKRFCREKPVTAV